MKSDNIANKQVQTPLLPKENYPRDIILKYNNVPCPNSCT